jgi:hypothetical protein
MNELLDSPIDFFGHVFPTDPLAAKVLRVLYSGTIYWFWRFLDGQ